MSTAARVLKDIYHHFYPREFDGFIRWVKRYYSPNEILVIFDIGSRDAEQSIELAEKFPNARVFAFECNPDTLEICYKNAEKNDRVTVVPKAITDYDGTCSFYKNNPKKMDVQIPKNYLKDKDGPLRYLAGGSSLFSDGPADASQNGHQIKVTVDCTRLDTFCRQNNIHSIDLIWMDLEGAELLALKSLGDQIKNVKMIQTEAQVQKGATNKGTFFEIQMYLASFGFDFLEKKRVQKNIDDQEGHTDVVFKMFR